MDASDVTHLDSDIDPTPSPLSSIGITTTPDTELSPPESPYQKHAVPHDCRLSAKAKLATLTLQEKVEFTNWRSLTDDGEDTDEP